MRNTRITVLGIVVFLFLQALSSCLRIGTPRYDIDEDSLFFSRMPPRTETGANIVAFELDGKPYVFPKEGMRKRFFYTFPWRCNIMTYKEKDSTMISLNWWADRTNKRYCATKSFFQINLSEENLHQEYFETRGKLGLGGWGCEGDYVRSEANGISFEITRHDRFRGIICGRFSGVLKTRKEEDPIEMKRIENGFFDLTYE